MAELIAAPEDGLLQGEVLQLYDACRAFADLTEDFFNILAPAAEQLAALAAAFTQDALALQEASQGNAARTEAAYRAARALEDAEESLHAAQVLVDPQRLAATIRFPGGRADIYNGADAETLRSLIALLGKA